MRKLSAEELNRISADEFRLVPKHPLVVVLDNIRSAHNVGAFFRTSDAFLVEKIFLCGITATPPHKEIHKAALGATETVEWEHAEKCEAAIMKLKDLGFIIVVVEQTSKSTPLQDFIVDKDKKYALIFGNEVFGVSDHVIKEADVALEIPQFGTKHSLNVSVSGGVVLWELAKQFI